MREIYLEVRSSDDNEVRVEIIRQSKTGASDIYKDEDSVMVVSGKPESKRTISLLGNEQLIIRPLGGDIEMVYDREQNAAMPKAAFESQPSAEEKKVMEEERQIEVDAIRHGETKVEHEKRMAASRAADEIQIKAADEIKADIEKRKAEAKEHREAPTITDRDTKPAPSVTTSTPQGSPQSPAAAKQAGQGSTQAPNRPASPGGMTAPGPSTGGKSSKDV